MGHIGEGRCVPADPGYPALVPIPNKTSAGADGAVAGAVATVVMTAVLEAGRRLSLFHTQPPTRIVRTVLTGRPDHRVPGEVLLAGLAHLGYGASCGAVFAVLTRRRPTADLRLGVGYGLVLWLAGYGLWVPAIGALPPLHRDRPDRQLTLVAGHVVYGASLAGGLRRCHSGDEGRTRWWCRRSRRAVL